MNTCINGRCRNTPHRAGLCRKHYANNPTYGTTNPHQTRKRINELHTAGMDYTAIAAAAGITTSGLNYIRHEAERIKRTTAHAIHAIQPRAGAVLVPALGARRRLQALSTIGWSQRQVAQLLGTNQQRIHEVVANDRVRATTAQRITELYERLCMTPGPSRRARQAARKAGWLPPLAWDNIDHPNEQPHPVIEDRRMSVAEKYDDLVSIGYTNIDEIAHRIGCNRGWLRAALRERERREAA